MLAWLESAGISRVPQLPFELGLVPAMAHLWLRLVYQLTIKLELRWRHRIWWHPGRVLRWCIGLLIEKSSLATPLTRNHLLSLAQEIKGSGTRENALLLHRDEMTSNVKTLTAREDLHVLFVINSVGIGGAETQMTQLASELSHQGTRVAVLALAPLPENGSFLAEKLRAEGIPLLFPEVPDASTIALELGLTPELHRAAATVLRTAIKLNTNVLHAWLDLSNAAALVAGSILNQKVIADARSLRPSYFQARSVRALLDIYRVLGTGTNVHLTNNSEAGARDYELWTGLPADSIRHIPNGLPSWSEPCEPQKASDVGPRIGCLTRLSPEKNLQLWLHIAAKFRERYPTASFDLYGEGPELPSILKTIRRLRLEGFVNIHPFTKNRKLAIGSWHALLLSSSVEGLPNAAIEALSLGVPVVLNNKGGGSEVYPPELQSLVTLDPSDAKEYVVALEKSLKLSPEELTLAQEFVLEKFSLTRQVRAYKTLYRSSKNAARTTNHSE